MLTVLPYIKAQRVCWNMLKSSKDVARVRITSVSPPTCMFAFTHEIKMRNQRNSTETDPSVVHCCQLCRQVKHVFLLSRSLLEMPQHVCMHVMHITPPPCFYYNAINVSRLTEFQNIRCTEVTV
jgi:hypothetical protein